MELFVLRLPLRRAYETSGSRETHQTRVLCRVESQGAAGWGESVAPELPWYSGETPRTVLYALEEIIVPRLLATELAGPEDVERELAWIRDHRMAKATVEMAVWDLFAKLRGEPLSALLGGTRERIPCGVAIGIQPSIPALIETIRRELAGGYQRVKVKIKPGWDADVAEAIRAAFPDLAFMLDANSAYSLADVALFQHIDEYAHDDLVDHAALQREIRTAVCLDESIHSAEDARKAIAIGATRVVNIKAGRVGGLAEAKRVHDVCAARGIPVWCGGMLEMGIGRAHNVHLASLPNFRLPGDVSASARYFETEIIGEPFTVEPDGTMRVPTKPGIGVTVLEDTIRRLASERSAARRHGRTDADLRAAGHARGPDAPAALRPPGAAGSVAAGSSGHTTTSSMTVPKASTSRT